MRAPYLPSHRAYDNRHYLLVNKENAWMPYKMSDARVLRLQRRQEKLHCSSGKEDGKDEKSTQENVRKDLKTGCWRCW